MAIGDVDDVQLRVTSPRGKVPSDLTLAVVDPGATVTEPAESLPDGGLSARAITTTTTRTVAAQNVTTSTGPARPAILTRAQWGADEDMRSGKPSYGTIRAAFVHHTVNANDYTRAQVPAIIRGIYAYHTQSLGWSDIGYNFLVDRFGRIWEGRYGGPRRPVIGAHTYGYNHTAFAMSAIGNFETTEPSTKMLDAYGRLFAWKLSLHGIRARSTQTLGDESFRAISGHRDAGQTACPGKYLYGRLRAIRTRAANIQAGVEDETAVPTPEEPPAEPPSTSPPAPPPVPGPPVARDLHTDGLPDLVFRDAATGQLNALTGTTGPGFAPPRTARIRPGRVDLIAGVGDVTGDGTPDLLTRVRRSGVTQLRPGGALFGQTVPEAETGQFQHADLIAGVGNIAGTRRPDVVARDSRTGRMWVYPGKPGGRWGVRRLLLEDATRLRQVMRVGDLNGDRRSDVLAQTGRSLVLYPGLGDGQLGAPVVLARDWAGQDLTVAGHDFTGDDVPDLLARDRSTGRTWIYAVEEGGRIGPRFGGWDTWTGIDRVTPLGDPGSGATQLVGRATDGRIVVLDSRDIAWFQAPSSTGRAARDADFLQLAGDWDGDGHNDVITRSTDTGNVLLYRGTGDGRLTERSRLFSDWADKRDLVVTADLTGDELPDLLARDPDGAIYAYPSDGSGGKQKRRLARAHMFAIDLITPAGFWNGDKVRDLVVRRARDHQLYLVPGTPEGRLGRPVPLTDVAVHYDRILGVGDFNGDDQSDLVATEGAYGRIWLLPGTPTGLAAPEYLGPITNGFDLLG